MFVINTDSNQLPGGRCYQKGGARLEQALYNCLPDDIKKDTLTNLRPKNEIGDVIVEYDMIYNKGNDMISFEVKGLNYKTSRCPDRQARLFNQATRQKQFLMETYKNKNFNISVVFCIVTGKTDKDIDQVFINRLKANGIIISIGESPNETIKDAICQLKGLGYFTMPISSNPITIKEINKYDEISNESNPIFLVGSPDKVNDLDHYIKIDQAKKKILSYADVLILKY